MPKPQSAHAYPTHHAGFVVDPDGFCKDHYLIEGVLYDAYRLTYSLPPPHRQSFLSFLPRCTLV